jgi:hypothetical protein
VVLAAGAFVLTSATGLGCVLDLDGDQCESDVDCPDGALCDVGDGCSGGARCSFAPTCEEDADCAPDEVCAVRPADEASHPFDEDIPERGFCEPCDELECGEGGGGGAGGASRGASWSAPAASGIGGGS